MGGAELTVLVVDDDFRVANMHAGIVDALPGFAVATTVNTLAAARKADDVDLVLVDVYLPDGSGIDLVRELRGDAMVLTAATEAATVRAALAAGALSYLVKPFPPAELAAQACGLRPLPQDSCRSRPRCKRCRRSAGRPEAEDRRTAVVRCHVLTHQTARATGIAGLRQTYVVDGGLRGDRGVTRDRATVPGDVGRRR